MKLYAFWRSTASWRVRVALAYKGVPFDVLPVFLTGGEQYDKEAPARIQSMLY